MTRILSWPAPILRPHAGAMLGNGTQGLLVWGAGDELRITIGRSGFWDHRWGNPVTNNLTFDRLRELLESKDVAGLDAAFQRGECEPWERPQQMPAARLLIRFGNGMQLDRVDLDLDRALVTAWLKGPSGAGAQAVIKQSITTECFTVTVPNNAEVALLPAWDLITADLQQIGLDEPERWEDGFRQDLPEDDPLAVVMRRDEGVVRVATGLGKQAEANARGTLAAGIDEHDRAAWWLGYWADVPHIQLPDAILQEAVDYGLFKMACCTPPHGVACTLQGPFLEDYQIPPWSCDYHFNINIQMIYWPVLASGQFDHFTPLWNLLKSWWADLRENGKAFFGADGAMMLPHAVDDQMQVVGTFWTGSIDHACTAWMAHMAWLHYRYGGDRTVLDEVAWPLLIGSFEGFWAMLEEDGDRLRLPVSVSPEFMGDQPDAWGRDASFQLAAIHRTVRNLQEAAVIRGVKTDPRWQTVTDKLPPYTTIEAPLTGERPDLTQERIALWDGKDLVDSHRHHSHLGAVYPFCTIAPEDPAHAEVVSNSLFHWVRKGPGGWSGWCVPWASIIHARCGNADAAIDWLHWWHRHFVNEGRGTLHDANHPGHSTLTARKAYQPVDAGREVMQLDAGFGALNAVYELLVQQRDDIVHVLPGWSPRWRNLSFDGIHVVDGFVIGASVVDGAVTDIRIHATRDAQITLHHGAASVVAGGLTVDGPTWSGSMSEGDDISLKPVV